MNCNEKRTSERSLVVTGGQSVWWDVYRPFHRLSRAPSGGVLLAVKTIGQVLTQKSEVTRG